MEKLCKCGSKKILTGMLAVLIFALCFNTFPRAHEPPEVVRVVRVGWFPHGNYQTTSTEGVRSGYNYDYLMRIAEVTGWHYEFVEADWGECSSMLKAGELDLVGSVFSSEERRKEFAFPELDCGITDIFLCVREDGIVQENDFGAFDGMKIACDPKAQNYLDLLSYAAANSFSFTAVPCRTDPEITKAILNGSADAGVYDGLFNEPKLKVVARFSPRKFYFVTALENAKILDGLNRALKEIKLKYPYFDSTLAANYQMLTPSSLMLTPQEEQYRKKAEPLRVLCGGNWIPLEILDPKTNEMTGVVGGIFKLLSENTGLQFSFLRTDTPDEVSWEISKGNFDLIASFEDGKPTAQDRGLELSDAYLTIPLMMIRNPNASPEAVKLLAGVNRTHAYRGALSDLYEIRLYPTDEACVEALRQGKVGQILLNSYSANYYLSKSWAARYQVSTLQGLHLELRIAVEGRRDPELLSILNKGIAQMDEAQLNTIVIQNTSLLEKNELIAAINRLPVYVVMIFSGFLLLIILLLSQVLLRRAKSLKTINLLLYSDSLTGLLNQRGFEKEARRILDAAPKNRCYVITHFDINAFEVYNSIYGFEAGDRLLKTVARYAAADGIPEELCARLFNDNFVKLAQVRDLDEMVLRVKKFNQTIRRMLGGQSILISFGLYEITDRSLSISAMCDMALAAKRMVKGNYDRFVGVYDEALRRRQLEDTRLISSMEQALQNREFVAYYQPKYDVKTGRIAGAEALVRWVRPIGEMIPPGRFVELFEKNGLIVQLDRFMFRMVCKQLAQVREQGLEPVQVSVNFSRVHLFDRDFVDSLAAISQEYGVDPKLLEIELTESAFIVNPDILTRVIGQLHAIGFTVSMDDFGSGFSSLNMLRDMDFDVVKLDGGFLGETAETERGQKVIEGILFLARRLRLRTVAEGVETGDQLSLLKAHGCELAQGYYFSRPVPAHEFMRMLAARPALLQENPGIRHGKRVSLTEGEELGILEMRELLWAVSNLFEMVIAVNLSKNTYNMLEYEKFSTHEAMPSGFFDDLIEAGAFTVHPDDRQGFRDAFSRSALLRAYNRGEQRVSLTVRQRSDEGNYVRNETNVIFVQDLKNQDILELTFSHSVGVFEQDQISGAGET